MDNQDILSRNNLSDIEKLMLIFESDKESIKKNNPELYYVLLSIKDDLKIGYKFIL